LSYSLGFTDDRSFMASPSALDYKVTELGESPSGGNLTLLIVEDHEIVRDGLQRLIVRELRPTFSSLTVMHAATLLEARSIVMAHADSLDLILLDLELEDASADDCLNYLQHELRGIPVAVVSACEDWSLATKLLNLGVLGFIPKKSNVSILTNAIRLILAGGRYFPDEVLTAWKGSASAPVTSDSSEIDKSDAQVALPPSLQERLSPRQLAVINLMLEGLPNKTIARRLDLSLGTTKNYVASAMRTLGVSGRVNLVRLIASLQSEAAKSD
jgi:DNA-binding NarL/FixJ family response regulator